MVFKDNTKSIEILKAVRKAMFAKLKRKVILNKKQYLRQKRELNLFQKEYILSINYYKTKQNV